MSVIPLMVGIGGVLALLLVLTVVALMGLHLGLRAPKILSDETPVEFAPDYQSVVIPSVDDVSMQAWWLAHAHAVHTIVVVHGWGSNRAQMLPFARVFFQAGYNVLLFDARNHGHSERAGHSSMPRFAQDISHALAWLRQYHPLSAQKIALLGHSVGASAAILEASRRTDMDALISVSAFAHPEWLMKRFFLSKHIPAWLAIGFNRYIQWVIGHPFDEIASVHALPRVHCPVLLIHGQMDAVVPIEDARILYQTSSGQNVQLWEIPLAGHSDVELIETYRVPLVSFLQNVGFCPVTHVK